VVDRALQRGGRKRRMKERGGAARSSRERVLYFGLDGGKKKFWGGGMCEKGLGKVATKGRE